MLNTIEHHPTYHSDCACYAIMSASNAKIKFYSHCEWCYSYRSHGFIFIKMRSSHLYFLCIHFVARRFLFQVRLVHSFIHSPRKAFASLCIFYDHNHYDYFIVSLSLLPLLLRMPLLACSSPLKVHSPKSTCPTNGRTGNDANIFWMYKIKCGEIKKNHSTCSKHSRPT